jgi:hypothetical protein
MRGNGLAIRTKGGKSMQDRSPLKILALVLVTIGMLSLGCNQVVTVHWSKPGAGNAKLQEDKEECQSLQRAVGLNEERIEKCLEAQGWSPVRQEIESAAPNSE